MAWHHGILQGLHHSVCAMEMPVIMTEHPALTWIPATTRVWMITVQPFEPFGILSNTVSSEGMNAGPEDPSTTLVVHRGYRDMVRFRRLNRSGSSLAMIPGSMAMMPWRMKPEKGSSAWGHHAIPVCVMRWQAC